MHVLIPTPRHLLHLSADVEPDGRVKVHTTISRSDSWEALDSKADARVTPRQCGLLQLGVPVVSCLIQGIAAEMHAGFRV